MGEGNLVIRILSDPPSSLYIRVDGAALDRAGADQRHLDGQVVDVSRPHPGQDLHLGPALDLEDPGGLGPLDHCEDLLVV